MKYHTVTKAEFYETIGPLDVSPSVTKVCDGFYITRMMQRDGRTCVGRIEVHYGDEAAKEHQLGERWTSERSGQ